MRVQLREIFTYDEDDGVVCCYCRDAKATGDFSTGKVWNDVWKLDFLKRHLSSKSHTNSIRKLRNKNPTLRGGLVHMLLESPTKKENRQISNERKRSSPDEIKVLIDSVLLAIKMNISLLSVQDINEHMAKYVSIPQSWRSKNYAFEFLGIINGIVQEDLMADIKLATYHTLTVDESTDISVNKYLILYFKYRPVNSKEYRTSFGGMLQLEACDATSIVTAVREFYGKHKLDLNKMVMFTSDGASVMLGKINGVAAQLRKDVPHLVQQHCVAHREDLGLSDSWKEVKLMKEVETLMRTVYTVFCRSSTKRCKFQEIADASECESIAFRPLNEVRWLSRHFALQAIIRNYDPLLKYFEESKDNDPISKYCYKKLKSEQFHITLEILNDVLSEMASLTLAFQKRGLTPLEAYHLAQGKLNKLRMQYLGEKVKWSDKVNSLLDKVSAKEVSVDTNSILTFINILCLHLGERFPENEIEEWSAFDCTAIAQCDFDFGIEHIRSLCLKYKQFLQEESVIIQQYNDFKFLVAEKIKSNLINSFPDMTKFSFQNDQFAELAKLMDIGATFLASSADCERGFSLMNNLKTKQRNRLQLEHLEMLMRIKSNLQNGGTIDLDRIYSDWINMKDRREKL
uniref:HAT C-terminal dimerisation domain-containing protein n=1 Tax=Xenopus tropicalis TaxID=8364 RepID=A0A1B8Y9W5_XENTR